MALLLDCISSEKKRKEVCAMLENYQKKHFQTRFSVPANDYKQVVIKAPDYIEIQKEMSRPPRHVKRIV